MSVKFVNIGFGNVVASDKVVSIVSPESAPIKRIIHNAKETNMLIDATFGRRTRAVIITNSGHIIISGIQVETIVNRFNTIEE